MNWKAAFVVLILGLGALTWSRPAAAEKVKTNQTTKLYSRAGEQSPVILKLKSGQSMTVLAKDGRWLKVRVSGRTGWVPRSKVDMPNDDEEIARNTRRRPFVDGRGTKRGFTGDAGPDDRVGADATGEGQDDDPSSSSGKSSSSSSSGSSSKSARASKSDDDDDDKPAKSARSAKPDRADRADKADKADKSDDDDTVVVDDKEPARPMGHVAKSTPIYNDPDSSSDPSFTAGPKTALYVVEEKGKWTFVENDEGDAGYVLTSKLEVENPTGPRSRAIDLRGRLGLSIVNQSVSTPGGTSVPIPDNYSAGSSTVTLALGAGVLYPYKARYWLGGELALDYDRTLFGGIENMMKTTAFTLYNFNLRASGGYDLQNSRGMIVFGRLGYHYDSFQVDDVSDFTKNTAKLPNQIIQGPTIGAALAVNRLTPKLALRFSLDTMLVLGKMEQTVNLEDGTGPSAKAFYFGAGMTYHWKPKMDLQFNLDADFTSISFSGPAPAGSMRGHTGTGTASGSDSTYTGSFGIAYAL